MAQKIHRKTLIIFYILCGYIIAQFSWWAYMLLDLNRKFYTLKGKFTGEEEQYISLFENKTRMIIGEGVVFMVLLLLGFYFVLRAFKKEVLLSQRHQNFILSITHELKTPIATIKLYLQTLLKHRLTEEKRTAIYQTTLQETERLNQLIENILLSAKVDSAMVFKQNELVNISELTTNVFQNQQAIAKGLSATIQPAINFNISPIIYESLVTNLLDNAIKYAPKEPQIELKLTQIKQLVTLTVSDNGIGIPDSEKEKVFNRFYRSENENTRATKGTGLGLYIVKNVVKINNGTIKIKDNSPKGTTFEVQFLKK